MRSRGLEAAAAASVALLVASLVTPLHAASTTEKVRFCGRSLSQAVSMVCRSFNSPSWDVGAGAAVGAAAARNRVKRDYGIVDECCAEGCSWDQLRLYCADDEPAFSSHEPAGAASGEVGHVIADRSVEAAAAEDASPALAAAPGGGFRGLFARSEMRQRGGLRGAPVVGTVSPLLVWGAARTVHASAASTAPLPQSPRDRLLYVTV